MRRHIVMIALMIPLLFIASAQAQPPVSISLSIAGGEGVLETAEEVEVEAVAIAIDLPSGGTITPVNDGEIAIGATEYSDCEVTTAEATEVGCVITLGCEMVPEEEFTELTVYPGGPGVGGIDATVLTEGRIVTRCLLLPPSEPGRPAR